MYEAKIVVLNNGLAPEARFNSKVNSFEEM
jgi:hypothetical protein